MMFFHTHWNSSFVCINCRHLKPGVTSSSSALVVSCPNQLISCPEEGCHSEFPASFFKKHLAKECYIAKKRLVSQ
jgi:hypothetical protein